MANTTQQLTATQQQRVSEYFKCKKDPIYFMENYIKLSIPGGDASVKLYNRQKEFIQTIFDVHHIVACKSRQTGVSTIAQMFCT